MGSPLKKFMPCLVLTSCVFGLLPTPPARAYPYGFDRRDVVSVAKYYAAVISGVPRDFGQNYSNYANRANGSDCTNFASNSVRVGGHLDTAGAPPQDNTNRNLWFSAYSSYSYDIQRTNSWQHVYYFWHYFQDIRRNVYFTKEDPRHNAQSADLADIILYDAGDDDAHLIHMTVETGYGSGTYPNTGASFFGDLISQHSPHRVNSPWNYWYHYYGDHDAVRRQNMINHGFYIMHWKDAWDGYSDG